MDNKTDELLKLWFKDACGRIKFLTEPMAMSNQEVACIDPKEIDERILKLIRLVKAQREAFENLKIDIPCESPEAIAACMRLASLIDKGKALSLEDLE